MKKEQIQQEIDKCKKEISLHQTAIDALNKKLATLHRDMFNATEHHDLIGKCFFAPRSGYRYLVKDMEYDVDRDKEFVIIERYNNELVKVSDVRQRFQLSAMMTCVHSGLYRLQDFPKGVL